GKSNLYHFGRYSRRWRLAGRDRRKIAAPAFRRNRQSSRRLFDDETRFGTRDDSFSFASVHKRARQAKSVGFDESLDGIRRCNQDTSRSVYKVAARNFQNDSGAACDDSDATRHVPNRREGVRKRKYIGPRNRRESRASREPNIIEHECDQRSDKFAGAQAISRIGQRRNHILFKTNRDI